MQLDKKTIAQVIGYLKKQKIDYVHFDVYKNSNLKTVQKTAQPAQTMILDLALSQDEMLKNMHSKTRYNIRLAQKKEVTILHKKDIEAFWSLTKITASRDGFTSHQKKYYEQMLALPFVEQFTAYLDQEVIASNLCVNFNGTFIYLHGASMHKYKKLMAPYLLQWHQILFAKDNGCKVYDFWGVAPKDDNGQKFHKYSWQKNHKWSGFTRFKAGFGGTYQETFFSKKLILSPIKYMLAKILRMLKNSILAIMDIVARLT